MSTLHLLKYVRSFVDGRVRIRHPALHNEAVAALAEARMKAIAGVISVECNPVSGSVLLTYDSTPSPGIASLPSVKHGLSIWIRSRQENLLMCRNSKTKRSPYHIQ